MRPVRARRAVRAPKPGTLAWVAIITIALTAAWLAAQLPARADDGVRETLRITAWPAELDDVEAGVNVDAWPEARTPLDVRVQPGQTVRLDAGPAAGGIDVDGRHWRFTGWLIQDTGYDAGWTPEPVDGNPAVVTFTASPTGPPAAARMTFAPEEGGAPPPPAEEEGGGPELHTDDLDQPAPAAPAPAPAPRQEQPAGLAGDMGLAIGSDGIDWDRANRIRSMGGRWVRIDLNWQRLEEVRGEPHWELYDGTIAGLRDQGLEPLVVLVGAPDWARRKNRQPDPDLFAGFAAAAVERYRGSVGNWEIWNEPNHTLFWEGKPNPAEYTELLNKASARMAEADPGANRIGAVLAQVETKGGNIDPREFLKKMYALGAGPNMTAVSVHPYCFWYAGSCPGNALGWTKLFSAKDSLRAIMNANGDGGKPLWVTEFGAVTKGGPGGYGAVDPVAITEEAEAAMVTDTYAAWRAAPGPKGPLIWYRPDDTCADPRHNECFYGLFRNDGSEKPGVHAFRVAAGVAAAGAPPPRAAAAPAAEEAARQALVSAQAGAADQLERMLAPLLRGW